MGRRVIRKLKILEVSGVDRPANAHARAAIIKRHDGAHIGDSKLDYSKIDLGALADVVLEGATTALLRAEPTLSREQAYAKIYTSPDYRPAAEAERAASAKRLLAGVPVARTAATILNDLSDESIIALVQEIRDENPFVSDAEFVRMIASSAEERAGRAAVQENVRHATREGARVPQPSDTLSAKRDAYGALTQKADELRKANPSMTKEAAFAAVYSAPANRELAKAERLANRPEG
jgi:hypothetical protein